ncbi:MAG: hypothetical protein NTU43_08575 [Bacteroidetes bacterium]|nr:hypothetical protein [Bacteroidota bacterium]
MLSIRKLSICIFSLLAIVACKKGFDGEKTPQSPPNTFMAVDSIHRNGVDRLTTRVVANWWGTSESGFVVGYEVSVDSMKTWQYTTRQDSAILLNIPPGSDSADIDIFVRAIDNLGQRDPSPASTLYPIKNTAPSVKFIYAASVGGSLTQNPTIAFPILKYNFQGIDPDGSGDIYQYELYLNDTNASPYILNAGTSTITLQGVKLDSLTNFTECLVFVGSSNKALSFRAQGLKLNASNTIYIRAVDKALAKSQLMASNPIYVKRPVSDILLVNAYSGGNLSVTNFYATRAINQGFSRFDTLQLTELDGTNYTQLAPDVLTQARTFSLFKKIIWFSDNAQLSLSVGQQSTKDFFDNNGKIFMALDITSSFDAQSNLLDFTPAQSLVSLPTGDQFKIANNSIVKPLYSNWPTLKTNASINRPRPFTIPNNSASSSYQFDSLYTGNLFVTYPSNIWTGTSTIMSIRRKTGGKANFIFTTLPVQSLDGNNNIDSLFNKILISELEFNK